MNNSYDTGIQYKDREEGGGAERIVMDMSGRKYRRDNYGISRILASSEVNVCCCRPLSARVCAGTIAAFATIMALVSMIEMLRATESTWTPSPPTSYARETSRILEDGEDMESVSYRSAMKVGVPLLFFVVACVAGAFAFSGRNIPEHLR